MKHLFLAASAAVLVSTPVLAAKNGPQGMRLVLATAEPVISGGRLRNEGIVRTFWLPADLVARSRKYSKVAAGLDVKLKRIFHKLDQRTPRNAVFANERGHWVARQRTGWSVDAAATRKAILQSIAGGKGDAQVVLKTTEPKRSVRDLAKRGILYHFGAGSSNFRGSPSFRERNIEVGALKLQGRYVDPGKDFDFNQYVGWVDKSTGFVPGFIIESGTLNEEDGGGICQVSTTIFRAAYEAGLPITERHQHSYRVHYYDPVGLEATVYAPEKNFRFRNDTGKALFIQTSVDHKAKTLRFDLFGVKPDRKVKVSSPVVTDFKPPAKPTYAVYPGVAKGARHLLDKPEQGMTVVIRRIVTMPDGKQRKDELKSVYVPWGAVYGVNAKDKRARKGGS